MFENLFTGLSWSIKSSLQKGGIKEVADGNEVHKNFCLKTHHWYNC